MCVKLNEMIDFRDSSVYDWGEYVWKFSDHCTIIAFPGPNGECSDHFSCHCLKSRFIKKYCGLARLNIGEINIGS